MKPGSSGRGTERRKEIRPSIHILYLFIPIQVHSEAGLNTSKVGCMETKLSSSRIAMGKQIRVTQREGELERISEAKGQR